MAQAPALRASAFPDTFEFLYDLFHRELVEFLKAYRLSEYPEMDSVRENLRYLAKIIDVFSVGYDLADPYKTALAARILREDAGLSGFRVRIEYLGALARVLDKLDAAAPPEAGADPESYAELCVNIIHRLANLQLWNGDLRD